MNGHQPTVFQPAGIARQVAAAFAPPVWTLAYVLDDRTGTPATNDTFTPVLATLSQAGNSITKTAVATVSAAGASYEAAGGVTCPTGSAYFLDVVPTAGELTTLQQKLDMAAMVAGETLLVWATFTTPSGWAAAHSSSNSLFAFGNLVSGSASGGVDFGIGSTERPQILSWAKGATAVMATVNNTDIGFCIDSALHAIVWELVCTAANTFKVRMHMCAGSGIVTTGAYTGELNFADPTNSGTAAPGCGTTGIRMLRRVGTTTNQTARSETVRQLGFARLPGEYVGIGPRACIELYRRPGDIPSVLRTFTGDVTVDSGPDGNADRSFGAITEADMFVFLDGGTALASHPLFTIETEGGPNKSSGSSAPITSNVNYVSNSAFEGTLRSGTSEVKFGRHKTGTWAGWITVSGRKLDGGNRGRAETKWTGGNVEILPGVEHWMAGLYYFDFMTEPGQAGQLVIMQKFPGPVPKENSLYGLYPPFAITLDTTLEKLKVQFGTGYSTISDVAPTLPSDMVLTDTYPAPYNTREAFRTLLQTPVSIVVKHKWHWDVTQGPRCQVWVNGVQIVDRAEAYGYRSPKGGADAKTTNGYFQCGIYPPSPYLTPNTKRDVYIKRAFCCKNVGNYTEAQIRAALTA
ncbi:MAG: hypothetical protein EOP39_04585 [Rubrivivax sp.]|nr:MAG: hypothetical protein EOP39_04585 [Rubrivivax sp.]